VLRFCFWVRSGGTPKLSIFAIVREGGLKFGCVVLFCRACCNVVCYVLVLLLCVRACGFVDGFVVVGCVVCVLVFECW
jgi:hypothetical protein